jgi:diaminopimelate decarboxylase
MSIMPAAARTLSHVYPADARLNEAGRLEVGGCDVIELAREHGTPAYVYAEQDMRARAREYVEAFRSRTRNFEVIYASKAFPATATYKLFAEEGLSVDCASGGELHLALKGGVPPERIYMHGNNKTEAELRYAVAQGVGTIVVDSFDEIERLERIAPEGQKVMLRITPGIRPTTHSYIQTGQVDSKFGFAIDDVPRAIHAMKRLWLCGLHAHIGSQIFELQAYEKLAEVLSRVGDYPKINLGGGLGIAYTRDDQPPSVDEYVDALLKNVPENVTVLCEPGRSLVGNAGVLLTRVEYVKPGATRNFLVVDAAMNDLIRPPLYGAWHEVLPVREMEAGASAAVYDVVGPVCESADFLAKDRRLAAREADLLAILSAGAYGMVMSSNYNSRPRAAEVLVSGSQAHLVRRRDSIDALCAAEQIPVRQSRSLRD